MKLRFIFQILFISFALTANGQVKKDNSNFKGYTNSRAPLGQNPCLDLPLGAIKPASLLKEMLLRRC